MHANVDIIIIKRRYTSGSIDEQGENEVKIQVVCYFVTLYGFSGRFAITLRGDTLFVLHCHQDAAGILDPRLRLLYYWKVNKSQ